MASGHYVPEVSLCAQQVKYSIPCEQQARKVAEAGGEHLVEGARVRNRALVVGGVVYLLCHESHQLMRNVAPQHTGCTPRAQWHCQVVSLPHIPSHSSSANSSNDHFTDLLLS